MKNNYRLHLTPNPLSLLREGALIPTSHSRDESPMILGVGGMRPSMQKGYSSFVIHHLSFALLVLFFTTAASLSLRAQGGHIVTIRPDRAAPGMNAVVEVLTLAGNRGRPFGYDALDSEVSVILVHPADSARVVISPPIVSWNGRLIQI